MRIRRFGKLVSVYTGLDFKEGSEMKEGDFSEYSVSGGNLEKEYPW